MKEDFLHYVWKFQKFDCSNIKTTNGDAVVVFNPGMHNDNSGPDFFNSNISIDGQRWAGNIEIHLKSSHWFAHGHQTDAAYDSVILHVVWEHDAPVFRNDTTEIPTLELKYTVDAKTVSNYRKLLSGNTGWIPCENNFHSVDDFVFDNWLERLYIERLERKSEFLLKEFLLTGNDWEALLFRLLSKNFGQQVNSDSFYSIATSLDFSVVRKCSRNPLLIEVLLLGQAGLISEEGDDDFEVRLHGEFQFLKSKFSLNNDFIIPPKFFRLRPTSFPTIRLSQLAGLYWKKRQLFSEIISAKTIDEYYEIFNCIASSYWDTHYNFGKETKAQPKRLSKAFIDLLLINTIIPLRFCYGKTSGAQINTDIINFAASLKPESNSTIGKFNRLRPKVKNAMESQALLQLKNEYCAHKRCLQCAIGNAILKQ